MMVWLIVSLLLVSIGIIYTFLPQKTKTKATTFVGKVTRLNFLNNEQWDWINRFTLLIGIISLVISVISYFNHNESDFHDEVNHKLDSILVSFNRLSSSHRAVDTVFMPLYEETKPSITIPIIDDMEYDETYINYKAYGNEMYYQARYPEAIEYYEKALDDMPRDPYVINNIAAAYNAINDYNKAIEYLAGALDNMMSTAIIDTTLYTALLNNLALAYKYKGKQDARYYDKADSLYKNAIRIDRKAFGENSPLYATDLNNIAGLFAEKQMYDSSEFYYEKAFDIFESQNPPDSFYMAISLINIAKLHLIMGDKCGAKMYKDSAQAIRDKRKQ